MTGLEILAIGSALASAGVAAAGTIAAGKAQSKAAKASARSERARGKFELTKGKAEAESELARGKFELASSQAEASQTNIISRLQGVQSMQVAEAEAQGLLAQIPLLQMQGKTAGMAADVEAQELDIQAKEELAQGSQLMLSARRRKNLALSTLTTRAASSGFMATDPTALRIADDIARYGAVQEGMELYGGLSRSEALKSASAARRYEGSSAQLASVMEARAAGKAATSMMKAGLFSAKTGLTAGQMAAANELLSGQFAASAAGRGASAAILNASAARRAANREARAYSSAAGAARTASYYSAGGTILGAASSFADKYNRYKYG